MNRRYRLKNRKRFYTFIMIMTVLISVIVFSSAVNGADTHIGYETITVERGDTLWDLAKEYSNGMEIRRYIEKIKDLNELSDSNIYEGDTLKMPV